jgi:hypothetical protein
MVPPPAAASSSAHVLSLVKPATTLRRDDIEGLAAALLDLGGGYESALRTVLTVQRLLERVRKSEDVSPEAALLLQEMSRRVAELTEGSAAMIECLEAVGARLSGLKGDRGE